MPQSLRIDTPEDLDVLGYTFEIENGMVRITKHERTYEELYTKDWMIAVPVHVWLQGAKWVADVLEQMPRNVTIAAQQNCNHVFGKYIGTDLRGDKFRICSRCGKEEL